ncbi:MAG TPA: DUF3501 family protein [Acidiferrobacterales bacterium]|nr:DUF3501 family protein [Acidiferrobacterales bacterium]
MEKLTPQHLYSLEKYSAVRADFRAKVMEHKKNRQVQIGPHARLYFEDKLTIQYQVQEMLRAERIFERAGIEEELEAYNPLIPDGSNWKATFMLEYDDIEERRAALAKMIGIEDCVWVKVQGHSPVFAIADEDLERATETKTSSVHFLRFELSPEMVRAIKQGADIGAGIDHSAYRHQVSAVSEATHNALAEDLTDF